MVYVIIYTATRYFSVDIIKYRHLTIGINDTRESVFPYTIILNDISEPLIITHQDLDGLLFLYNNVLTEYMACGIEYYCEPSILECVT